MSISDFFDKSTRHDAVDVSTIYEAAEANVDPTKATGVSFGVIDDSGQFYIVGDGGETIQYDH